jgi:hypothetical protein
MYQEKQQPGSMPNPYAQQGPANGQHVINQPGMTQQMGMRSGALDAGLQRDAEGKREWKHGLFGCFNACGNCEYSNSTSDSSLEDSCLTHTPCSLLFMLVPLHVICREQVSSSPSRREQPATSRRRQGLRLELPRLLRSRMLQSPLDHAG